MSSYLPPRPSPSPSPDPRSTARPRRPATGTPKPRGALGMAGVADPLADGHPGLAVRAGSVGGPHGDARRGVRDHAPRLGRDRLARAAPAGGRIVPRAALAAVRRRLARALDPAPERAFPPVGECAGDALHHGLLARLLGPRRAGDRPADRPADGDPLPLQRAERPDGDRPGPPARGLQPAGHPGDVRTCSRART